jgi:hypothetical protein
VLLNYIAGILFVKVLESALDQLVDLASELWGPLAWWGGGALGVGGTWVRVGGGGLLV